MCGNDRGHDRSELDRAGCLQVDIRKKRKTEEEQMAQTKEMLPVDI